MLIFRCKNNIIHVYSFPQNIQFLFERVQENILEKNLWTQYIFIAKSISFCNIYNDKLHFTHIFKTKSLFQISYFDKLQHQTTGYNYRYPILSIDMYLSNIYQLQFNCYAFRMDSVTLRQFICGKPIEYINQAKYRSLYHLS